MVISIADKVKTDEGYHLKVSDIEEWEKAHGRIAEGAVVFVRSDWYKKWSDRARFNQKPFPGVSLDALKFLHLERNILFHGHEPLDTDTTPTLEGEALAAAQRLHAGRGRRQPRQGAGSGRSGDDRLCKTARRLGRLSALVAIAPRGLGRRRVGHRNAGSAGPSQTAPLKRDENGVFRPTP